MKAAVQCLHHFFRIQSCRRLREAALSVIVVCFFLGVSIADELPPAPQGKPKEERLPLLHIKSQQDLKAHTADVQPFLPSVAFLFDGYWVLPRSNQRDGLLRAWKDDPTVVEQFSPNGNYVLTFEPVNQADKTVDSKNLRLRTTQGNAVWEKEQGPAVFLVTNSGVVLGREINSAHVTVYDSSATAAVHEVTPDDQLKGEILWNYFPDQDSVVMWNANQIVVFDSSGKSRWRTALSPEAQIEQIGWDPLKRGIYVYYTENRTSNLMLRDETTGELKGYLWQARSRPPPQTFSASGKYASVVASDFMGIVNWQTGDLVFQRGRTGFIDLIERKSWKISAQSVSGVSDDIPRIVVQLAGKLGLSVFEAPRPRLWWCNLGTTNTKAILSADGRTLGVWLMKSDTPQPVSYSEFQLFVIEK